MKCLPSAPPNPKPDRYIFSLTRLGSDLGGGTLGTLLALDALSSTLASRGGGLSLVGLLLALGGSLLLLGVLDGLLAGSGTGLGALRTALLDHVKGGTDDATLVLDSTAGTLLSNFLFTLKSSVSLVTHSTNVIPCIPYSSSNFHVPIPISRGVNLSRFLHITFPNNSNSTQRRKEKAVPTSEIPFLCWRRKRTVQAIRRGFLRWRKRDSDFPFWKRKILLSPRTNSLPCFK